MTADLFFDFNDLEKEHTRRKKDSSNNTVLIFKVTWMNFVQAVVLVDGKKVTEMHSNEVWLRYTYSSTETWSKVSLLNEISLFNYDYAFQTSLHCDSF